MYVEDNATVLLIVIVLHFVLISDEWYRYAISLRNIYVNWSIEVNK
jgi:hypothetical protein